MNRDTKPLRLPNLIGDLLEFRVNHPPQLGFFPT
ncbi:hypothetical protein SAMN05421863_10062 [Nitrosomonas communis]|uniref:Uncharacterized protein n=1 Tax=Nitrosomonas communis TaxID=44574 RepID=A0A1I4L6V3_9PROT|nr:hypothetical protein SAMN05421863_10062 [Nitrosomonas communis]